MLSTIKHFVNSSSIIDAVKKVYRQLYWLPRRLKYSYMHPWRYKVTICGKEVWFSTTDMNSFEWFILRFSEEELHEPKTTALLVRLSQRGEDILDVGANLGWFTCAAGVVSESAVHAFEMDEENFRRLCSNVSLNGLQNVKTKHAAVTNSPGHVLYSKNLGPINSELSLKKDQEGDKVYRAESITLDDYVEKNCPAVGVIKIDVEGGEKEVLQGGAETIRKFRPHILLEVHPHQVSVSEVLSVIPNRYRVYHVENFRVEEGGLIGEPIDTSSFDPEEGTMLYAEPSSDPFSGYPRR